MPLALRNCIAMKFGSTSVVGGLFFALIGGACSASSPKDTPGSATASGGGPTQVTTSGGGPMLIVDHDNSAGTAGGGASAGGSGTQEKGCDDSCSAVGKCDDGTCRVTDNTGKLSPEQQAVLQKGGSADAQFRWLYPSDKTVFPRGLTPPILQFDGGSADAFYVHVSFTGFDYQGFFGPSDPARLKFSSALWTSLTSTARGTDSVKVEVSKLSAGLVTGPISESWVIAPGSLHGALYYESLPSAAGAFDRAVMRLKLGTTAPQVILPGADAPNVSADGSTLLAVGGAEGFINYDLKAAMTRFTASGAYGVGGALYPDGSLALFFPFNAATVLVDPRTGASVTATGLPDAPNHGAEFNFSPDGSRVAFSQDELTISLLDFVAATKTFSNLREIAQNPKGFITTPVFTPDARSVVHNIDRELHRVNTDTLQASRLDAACGADTPAGSCSSSYASVLPVSVGGYYWVVFSSGRAYGNTLTVGVQPQLWVAALDHTAGATDSSHPALYLDDQDAEVLNRNANWVLDPCQGDGTACSSGDQCCGGYCRDSGGKQQCLSKLPDASCAAEFEKCTKPADCCDKTSDCINDRCAVPTPIVK